MKRQSFIEKSKKYRNELKRYIKRNFGRKCGHIGKDEISLDCIVCKAWLTYDFFSWFVDEIDDLGKFAKNKNNGKKYDSSRRNQSAD